MEPTATTDETTVLQQLSALWPTLTAKQRQLLSEHIVIRTYEKHEIIHMEEDNASQLYYLLDGKVKIYKEGVGGRSQIVRMAKPQGFFGYRAGFADDVYSTSASAFETTTLGIIPVSVMKDIIKENNDVAVYFLRQLATLLRHADEQTVNLTQKHIRGRLAESLLHLKEQYGTDVNTGVLNIQLSREDLASLSNMTTSNAIRTLSSFANENLITIDGRRIAILEEDQMLRISRMG